MYVHECLKDVIDACVTRLPCEDYTRTLLSQTTMFPTFRGHHAMIRIMRRVLEDDSHTVDAGANRGRVLKHLLRLAPEGEHDAFEPQSNMTALLTQQFDNYPNINIHCKALGARPGIVNFASYEKAPTLSTFYPRIRFGCLSSKEYRCRSNYS